MIKISFQSSSENFTTVWLELKLRALEHFKYKFGVLGLSAQAYEWTYLLLSETNFPDLFLLEKRGKENT